MMLDNVDKLDAGLFMALRAWEASGEANDDDRISVGLTFEGDLAAIEALGFETQAAGPGDAMGVVRFKDIAALTAHPAVLWLASGRERSPALDNAVKDVRARASTSAAVGTDGLWHAVEASGTIDNNVGDATGSGVIVAVIDTGLDYTHPMFQEAVGPPAITRILKIWDQGLRPAAVAECPDPALLLSTDTYGVEYEKAEIETALNGLAGLRHHDCVGHGTHVAGIAAGGNQFAAGGNARFMGVAPQASIIAVKLLDLPQSITYFTGPPGRPVGPTARFRDAMIYCLRSARALGKPIVVNMSFGNSAEPGDGLDEDSAWVDQVMDPAVAPGPLNFPTRAIIVKAAGNDGHPARRQVARIVMPGSGQLVVPLKLIDERGGAQTRVMNCVESLFSPTVEVDFWYRRANPFDSVKFALRYPDSAPGNFTGDMPIGGNLSQGFALRVGPPRLTVIVPLAANAHGAFALHGGNPAVAHQDGGTVRRHNFNFQVAPKVVGGTVTYYEGIYEMRIKAPPTTEIFVMCGVEKWGPGQRVRFQVNDLLRDGSAIDPAIEVSPEYAITDGFGRHVITVAAYDDEDALIGDPHAVAAFSSRGPLRDYSDPPRAPIATKPDIAAPGVAIMSADSVDAANGLLNLFNFDWLSGRRFTPKDGTSMAAPMVAGVIALMLDKNPNLSTTDVRDLLTPPAAARPGVPPPPPLTAARAFGAGMVDALRSHVNTP